MSVSGGVDKEDVEICVLEYCVWVCGCVHSLFSRVQLCNCMDCNPPDLLVHRIFQAGTLEWVSISFSRESSWPRDRSSISCIGRWVFHYYAPGAQPLKRMKNAICCNMDRPRDCHTEWSQAKRNIRWYCIYAQSRKKWWKYLQNRNGLTDLENKLMVTKDEDWGEGIAREFGMHLHTLLHLTRITNKELLYSTGTLLNVMWPTKREKNLKRSEYMYINWITLLYTSSYHNTVYQVYSNIKYKVKQCIKRKIMITLNIRTVPTFPGISGSWGSWTARALGARELLSWD